MTVFFLIVPRSLVGYALIGVATDVCACAMLKNLSRRWRVAAFGFVTFTRAEALRKLVGKPLLSGCTRAGFPDLGALRRLIVAGFGG